MQEEKNEDLKKKILQVAWEMFSEKGYRETTLKDIIEKAGTSKGGFYYYFQAKDDLLDSLFEVFDREYEKYYQKLDKNMDTLKQLRLVCQYVFFFIEANVSSELMGEIYISQLTKKSQVYFQNPDRYYTRLIRKIIKEGQEKKEIRGDIPAEDLAYQLLVAERGVLIDWCVRNGDYSLGDDGIRQFFNYMEYMKLEG